MKTKESWINEIFESLDGIKRPEADAHLLDKIQKRIENKAGKIVSISFTQLAKIAACALLLISINAYTCIKFNNTKSSVSVEQNTFSKEYFSYMDNIQL